MRIATKEDTVPAYFIRFPKNIDILSYSGYIFFRRTENDFIQRRSGLIQYNFPLENSYTLYAYIYHQQTDSIVIVF